MTGAWRADTEQLFEEAWVASRYPGFGIRGADIPTTGEHGGSILANDVSLPGDADKEFRFEVLTRPEDGEIVFYEDGSIEAWGFPDGTYSGTYRLYQDGEAAGTATYTLIFGESAEPVERDFLGGFSITSAVERDFLGGYAVSTHVVVSFAGAYTVRGAALADFLGEFSTAGTVARDFLGEFSIDGATGTVARDFLGEFSTAGTVLADFLGEYSTFVTVERDFLGGFSIAAPAAEPVERDFTGAFSTAGLVWADFLGVFSLGGAVWVDFDGQYSVVGTSREAPFEFIIPADRWRYTLPADKWQFIVPRTTLMAIFQTLSQQPADILDYAFNFERWASNRGDAVDGAHVIIAPAAADGFSVEPTVDGDRVILRVKGGASGQRYKVSLQVDTAGGLRKEVDLMVAIKEV
jgi:hypothetical protein